MVLVSVGSVNTQQLILEGGVGLPPRVIGIEELGLVMGAGLECGNVDDSPVYYFPLNWGQGDGKLQTPAAGDTSKPAHYPLICSFFNWINSSPYSCNA